MSENVFDIVQIGPQAGTAYAPGAAVPATFLFPVEAPVAFELDRASQYPRQDRGRNVRNAAATGFHGVRGSSTTLPGQAHFEDLRYILEMIYAGGIAPVGAGPYVWTYPFEAGAPTIVPATIQGGNTDTALAQMRLTSCLVDSLTLGFPAITAPGASPWALSASVLGFDREVSALTAALAAKTGLETIQGHLTRLYEGTTATAFAALVEIAGSLKSFTLTASRSLVRRAYGSASDIASAYGFSEPSNATFEALVAVNATSMSDFHDVWNAAAPAALAERRWRVKAIGTGTKTLVIDGRVGILAVPIDDGDGERLFKVTGEFADDATLNASHAIAITNNLAA